MSRARRGEREGSTGAIPEGEREGVRFMARSPGKPAGHRGTRLSPLSTIITVLLPSPPVLSPRHILSTTRCFSLLALSSPVFTYTSDVEWGGLCARAYACACVCVTSLPRACMRAFCVGECREGHAGRGIVGERRAKGTRTRKETSNRSGEQEAERGRGSSTLLRVSKILLDPMKMRTTSVWFL